MLSKGTRNRKKTHHNYFIFLKIGRTGEVSVVKNNNKWKHQFTCRRLSGPQTWPDSFWHLRIWLAHGDFGPRKLRTSTVGTFSFFRLSLKFSQSIKKHFPLIPFSNWILICKILPILAISHWILKFYFAGKCFVDVFLRLYVCKQKGINLSFFP